MGLPIRGPILPSHATQASSRSLLGRLEPPEPGRYAHHRAYPQRRQREGLGRGIEVGGWAGWDQVWWDPVGQLQGSTEGADAKGVDQYRSRVSPCSYPARDHPILPSCTPATATRLRSIAMTG